jgi:hypothetical protein
MKVGWSTDPYQETDLVVSALGMAIENRTPTETTVIRSNQGTASGRVGAHRRKTRAELSET